jgi:regulator of sigma E protease
MLLTIVAGVITLSVLIIVHELGHFIAGKATHCYVEEFGIGFPPRIWGKKWGETIYSINWIPFGGFNKLSGEIDPEAPRALAARSHAVRLLVMSGGMIMNLLLPFVLLAVAYMVPHNVIRGEVVVAQVAPGSPAEMVGIQAGDTIVSVSGKAITSFSDLARDIQLGLGKEISIAIKHADGTAETVRLVPRWRPPAGQGAVGIAYQYKDANPPVIRESLPFWKAVPAGAVECVDTLILYKNGIIGMIIGTVPFVPAGPVGIVQVAGEVAHTGISPLLELAAFISIAIGITQIIPFPALDGARIAFIVLEWARRGKRVSPKVEGIIHSIGFVILLGLMVLITYQDLARWITGGSLIP